MASDLTKKRKNFEIIRVYCAGACPGAFQFFAGWYCHPPVESATGRCLTGRKVVQKQKIEIRPNVLQLKILLYF
ncbi:MAG: hypothetical protein BGP14_15240 [Sphingobacteriales bacterium 44-15]|nr:MAG: hypothetical protein BGP14_15240 [Sphingobacteriales bacterium 44-15]